MPQVVVSNDGRYPPVIIGLVVLKVAISIFLNQPSMFW